LVPCTAVNRGEVSRVLTEAGAEEVHEVGV
jgi:hypothetical protein